MILEYLTKAIIGAVALFITVKGGGAFAKTFKVGNNWISSTSIKGLAYKLAAGFALMTALPFINDLVTSLMRQLPISSGNTSNTSS